MGLPVTVVRQGTAEWLTARTKGVTATDAAIIAGETGSVVELWAQKLGLVEPPTFDDETRQLMDDGLALQPYLLDVYRRRTGKRVRAVNTLRRSKTWALAMASPDGEVVGEPVGIEAKMTVSPRWPAAMAAGDPVPGDVLAQVQWQAYVCGWEATHVVVLLYGRPKIIEIPRDDDYIGDLVDLARTFWGWVESGTRPPIDGSENARRVLSALHPQNDGTLIAADAEMESLAERLRAARAASRLATDEAATLENTIRALIGDGDGIEGSFGRITLKNNSVKDWTAIAADCEPPADLVAMHTTTNWKAVAETLRVRPEVIARHTMPGAGPRVIRLPKGW